MLNVFVIEAPFQLISAYSASLDLDKKGLCLVVRVTGLHKNDLQVENLLSSIADHWGKIVRIKTTSRLDVIKKIAKLKLGSIFRSKVVAIGDYRSGFCKAFIKIIRPRELWLLDDGVALLNSFGDDISADSPNDESHLKDREAVLQSFQNHIAKKKIVLKTFLDIKPCQSFSVDRISLKKGFQYFRVPSQKVVADQVFFLGSKFDDDGLISYESYRTVCEKVAEKFDSMELIYLPHRGESEGKLKRLQCEFGFRVLRPELPVEIYMARADQLPGRVISMCSAALFTIPELFPEIRVSFIEIDTSEIPFDQRAGVDECYKYIQNSGIAESLFN